MELSEINEEQRAGESLNETSQVSKERRNRARKIQTENMTVRVPLWVKRALNTIADDQQVHVSDLVRRGVLQIIDENNRALPSVIKGDQPTEWSVANSNTQENKFVAPQPHHLVWG